LSGGGRDRIAAFLIRDVNRHLDGVEVTGVNCGNCRLVVTGISYVTALTGFASTNEHFDSLAAAQYIFGTTVKLNDIQIIRFQPPQTLVDIPLKSPWMPVPDGARPLRIQSKLSLDPQAESESGKTVPGRRQSATFCKKMNMLPSAPKRVSELLFTIGVHCRGIYDVDTEIDCQANQPIDGLVIAFFEADFGSAKSEQANLHIGLTKGPPRDGRQRGRRYASECAGHHHPLRNLGMAASGPA
jgi:hypothetical protein